MNIISIRKHIADTVVVKDVRQKKKSGQNDLYLDILSSKTNVFEDKLAKYYSIRLIVFSVYMCAP